MQYGYFKPCVKLRIQDGDCCAQVLLRNGVIDLAQCLGYEKNANAVRRTLTRHGCQVKSSSPPSFSSPELLNSLIIAVQQQASNNTTTTYDRKN